MSKRAGGPDCIPRLGEGRRWRGCCAGYDEHRCTAEHPRQRAREAVLGGHAEIRCNEAQSAAQAAWRWVMTTASRRALISHAQVPLYAYCMYDILQSSKSASSTQHTRGKYRKTGSVFELFPRPTVASQSASRTVGCPGREQEVHTIMFNILVV